MERVERFEDLIAWQKARELTRLIYGITDKGRLSRDSGLRDQMQRSAVSVMSDIAEGFERGRRTEFHQFLVIAKGSCAELRSQLYVALDVGYIDVATFQRIDALAQETSRVVGGLRSAVQNQSR